MKILGIHDGKNQESGRAIAALSAWAALRGHEATWIDASSLSLKPCIGCFGCWIKTPGTCVIDDDGRALVLELAPAGLILTLGRIPFGSFAPSIKRALDRSIPVLLPFFTIHEGEMHHVQRYPVARRVIHIPCGDCGAEELATFAALSGAHCDNLLAPRPRAEFLYRGDDAALAAFMDAEAAA